MHTLTPDRAHCLLLQDTSLAAIGGTAIVVTTSLTLEDSSTPSLSVVGTLVERCGRAGVLVRSSGPAMSATVLVVNSTIVGCQVGIDMRTDNTSAVYVVQSVLAANKVRTRCGQSSVAAAWEAPLTAATRGNLPCTGGQQREWVQCRQLCGRFRGRGQVCAPSQRPRLRA